MPFAGEQFASFADCVEDAKRKGIDDPDAYCGTIKHRTEDKSKDPSLEFEAKDTCGCKDAITERGSKDGGSRIIRFIGVTDATSNKHRFPHNVMQQMVDESKDRFLLPYHPKSVLEIDSKMIKGFEEAGKALSPTKTIPEPIPIRDYHNADSQFRKVGRVLSVQNTPFHEGGKQRFYHDVVAEVFDPHMVKLLDRGMATKFSIGFKHRYGVESGIKVSEYAKLDHYGFVDAPADGEANLLEVKERVSVPKKEEFDYKQALSVGLELLTKANEECIAKKVSEGLSQEEASSKCEGEIESMAGKAEDPFVEAGAPDPENDQADSDCVAGLVSEGLSREAAEAACRGKDHDRSSKPPSDVDAEPKPGARQMLEGKQLVEESKLLQELKSQRELASEFKEALQEQGMRLDALLAEKKDLEIKREVERLMLEGKVLPGKKEKVYKIASAFATKEDRNAYYDTLETVVDFGEAGAQDVYAPGESEMATAAKELWGVESVDDMVIGSKG